MLSACWLNLAREIFQQNEKTDLLSVRSGFWFHAHRWERRSPDRLVAKRELAGTVPGVPNLNCLQTMESLTTVLLKPGEGDRIVAGHPWIYHGEILQVPPSDVVQLEKCEPIYESLPGWKTSTENVQEPQLLQEPRTKPCPYDYEIASNPEHPGKRLFFLLIHQYFP